MKTFETEKSYLKAKQQVADIRKFYNGLISYGIVISMLAGINYYFNEWANAWFLWAAFGWGLGLFIQAGKAYRWSPFMSRDWEERKIREFMEREERQQGKMGRWE